ncbi:hypothetical protein [Clostridium thermobutyricum]|nr:hypothetical protein [Clostridium thermobutyricum]
MRKTCKFSITNTLCEKEGKNPICKGCSFYKKRNYIEDILNKYSRNN